MSGRNPAPWILVLTLAVGAGVFIGVHNSTDDVSGRKEGTALLIVIGVGIAVMVIAQRAWMKRTRRNAALENVRAAREGAAAGTITDPSGLEPNALLVAMATGPVDEEGLVAGGDAAWAIAEQSQRSAMWMTLLIVALMVPAIALQNVKLIVFGAIPIVLYAVFLAGRVLRPGGTLDKAWAASDLYLSPLGLQGEERPDVVFVPRLAGEGMQSKLVGPTVLRGTRHGREVEITIQGGRSETHVACAAPAFRLKGSRQRVVADGDVPTEVALVLEGLHASPRWTGMKLEAGPDGIVVGRRAANEQRWLYDLWLAERLADAVRA